MPNHAPPRPLAVMDARDDAQASPALQTRLDWLRTQGINPDDTRHIEVFDDDGLYAIVTAFAVNEAGHRYCTVDHDHKAALNECRIAETERRVPVSALPPVTAAAHVH